VVAALLSSCASLPLYPSRPGASTGAPPSDPLPAKIVVHLAATSDGLRKALDATMPFEGDSTFELRGTRSVHWRRGPFGLRFADGRVEVQTDLALETELPLFGKIIVPLQVAVTGEPIITTDWKARMQGAKVKLESKDMRLRTLDGLAGAKESAAKALEKFLEGYSWDMTPQVTQAYQKIAVPIALPAGGANACATLKVTSIEAGPTVIAGGFEKDLAFVVSPSVSLPCAANTLPPQPPPLANVATLPSGPFTVTVPIAASYDELAKAMSLAFTDGKLFFSPTFPELYFSNPEVFASTSDQLVLKVHLAGPITSPLKAVLDGDLYFAGHPQVVDNELRIPDLEPMVDTNSFLLGLKGALDRDGIRNQARQALKLDLGERLSAVRAKLSNDFAFGGDLGCLRADVAKIEVTGVYPHGAYLRVYVAATAQAGVHLPCPAAAVPVAGR
jgi:hypothetical protein